MSIQYHHGKIPVQVFTYAIDSRGRDKERYPKPEEYVIPIEDIFRNVIQVELVHALYETYGMEKYVNLCVKELQGNVISHTPSVSHAFTQLPLIHHLNEYTNAHYKSIKRFDNPLQKLSRLSISFRDVDENLYEMKEHYLRFEIMCSPYMGNEANKNLNLMSAHADVFTPIHGSSQSYCPPSICPPTFCPPFH